MKKALKTMKKIKSHKDLEIGKYYFCKSKGFPQSEVRIMKVGEISGRKYIGDNRIWAMEGNDQATEKYKIMGPIEVPEM